jgi:hypothetical protein
MDSQEAKQILALYRPGDTDSPDPRMAQALELARKDPQLAAWFGQHCAAHVKLANEPQAGQREASEKETAPPQATKRPDIILFHKPALFMLALTALVLLAGWLWSSYSSANSNNFASYRDRMARLVQRSYPMKIAVTEQSQLREYFRATAGPVGFTLPRNLDKLPATGGAVFTWHSQPVALLGLDGGGNTNLYLFLINRAVFAKRTPADKPEFLQIGRLNTATWSVGDTVYLLAGPQDNATLRGFLE